MGFVRMKMCVFEKILECRKHNNAHYMREIGLQTTQLRKSFFETILCQNYGLNPI